MVLGLILQRILCVCQKTPTKALFFSFMQTVGWYIQ